MAAGWPTDVSYVDGDVFSAADINDTNGTLNYLNPTSATNNQVVTRDSTAPGKVKWANSPANTLTTTGDLYYASAANTPARLGIGTTGQVLSVAGGVPSWAAAASGATFISRTSFSSSAGVTIDNLFSSTYENYLISIQVYGGTASPTLRMQARYGTTTYTSANYQYAFNGTVFGSSTFVGVRGNAVTYWDLDQIDSGATYYNSYNFSVYRPNASAWMTMTGALTSQVAGRALTGAAAVNANQSWTGLYLYAGAGNITGQVTVYGLAAA